MQSSRRPRYLGRINSTWGLSAMCFAAGVCGVALPALTRWASDLAATDPASGTQALTLSLAAIALSSSVAAVAIGLISVRLASGPLSYRKRLWVGVPVSLSLFGAGVFAFSPLIALLGLLFAVASPLWFVVGILPRRRAPGSTRNAILAVLGEVAIWGSMLIAFKGALAQGDIVNAAGVPISIALGAVLTAVLLVSLDVPDDSACAAHENPDPKHEYLRNGLNRADNSRARICRRET